MGKGNQGIVYDVVNHPGKVIKESPMRGPASYDVLKSESEVAKIASDSGFGPLVYDILFDGRVVNIADDKTIPAYRKDMVVSIVMEKIEVIEKSDWPNYYVGIVETLARMKTAGVLATDCFFGYSTLPQHTRQHVVAADFGVVVETSSNQDFIKKLVVYTQSCQHIESVVVQYAQEKAGHEFSKQILVPVLSRLEESRKA